MAGTNLSPQPVPVLPNEKLSPVMACVSRFQVFMWMFILPAGLGFPLIATNKLSLATWGSYYQQDHMGPGTYAFGYDIEDPVTGNIQFKQEERHANGTVSGMYGYVDADGRPHVVTYVSDENGYRVKLVIEGEPVRYFPDMSNLFRSSQNQNNLKKEKNGAETGKPNLLLAPLQGELFDTAIPLTNRFNYPSYYKYVGMNAVSK